MEYLNISEIFGVLKGKVERYVEKPIDYENLIKVALGKHATLPKLVDELVEFLIEMDHRLQTRQGVSKNMLLGFTRDNVNSFFDIYNIAARRVFNVDETGVTVMQHKDTKVISLEGMKRIGTITSQVRGRLEIETWLRHHSERAVSHYIIGRLFEKAYNNAATMDVSVRGFETTDCIPINRNVYADADFAAEVPRCHISPSSKIYTSSTPQPTVADSNLHISSQDS
ncbi:hypothetical protein ILUMI_16676 [Ignelater luminosus]|uniref:Uncharacterized protein n=1 Tax=Ignelater luminosus TaxID=2038154 RepID=A0A8K0G5R3_IGNLU|nr:hypothetical protein ILUMI_16676 [Ignelater luminosus]